MTLRLLTRLSALAFLCAASAPAAPTDPKAAGKNTTASGDWVAAAKPVAKSTPPFTLSSPAVKDGGALPVEFTGDGDGVSPPLSWSNAPKGTQGFVLIMHHLDPEGRTKIYWLMHDIAPSTSSAAKNDREFGKMGMSTVHNRVEYAPPHSKGPGIKKYVLTLFALSAKPDLGKAAQPITAEALLAACQGKILAAADLNVTYTRTGSETDTEKRPERKGARRDDPPAGK